MSAPKYAWILFFARIITMIFACAAYAEEATQPPLEPKDEKCNYVQQAGDHMQPVCNYSENGVDYKLSGKGYIFVRICGQNYTIDIECPQ